MNNAVVVKKVVRFITFPAVRHIVAGAAASVVPQRNAVERVLVFYGAFAISSLIADATSNHVEQKIDDAVAWYKSTVNTAPAN